MRLGYFKLSWRATQRNAASQRDRGTGRSSCAVGGACGRAHALHGCRLLDRSHGSQEEVPVSSSQHERLPSKAASGRRPPGMQDHVERQSSPLNPPPSIGGPGRIRHSPRPPAWPGGAFQNGPVVFPHPPPAALLRSGGIRGRAARTGRERARNMQVEWRGRHPPPPRDSPAMSLHARLLHLHRPIRPHTRTPSMPLACARHHWPGRDETLPFLNPDPL